MTFKTSPNLPHRAHNAKPITLVLLALLVTMAATFVASPPAYSQTATAVSTGTLTREQINSTCPPGFYPNMTCFDATVTGCLGTDDIALTIGYIGPTVRATPKGTIVFFSGGSGTSPSESGPDILSFDGDYVPDYTIVNVAWASAWAKARVSGTQNILLAACRPATLMKWINDPLNLIHTSGAMCAQGKSAGSAAIAYAMSWYGAGSYLKNVELLAGPVLSKMDDGCSSTPPIVSMCPANGICTTGTMAWSRSAGYTSDKAAAINSWGGVTHCATTFITNTQLQTLKAMSIVDGSYSGVTPVFSFTTTRHGWICAGANTNYNNYAAVCPTGNAYCPNNSSPQGYDWYAAAQSDINLKVSGTNQCDGTTTASTSTEAEGVDGANALDPDLIINASEKSAIELDMNTKCQ